MGWTKAGARELLGLFVDDGSDAVAILLWLAAMWLLARHLGLPSALAPVLLFGGLVVILLTSAWRRARKGRAR